MAENWQPIIIIYIYYIDIYYTLLIFLHIHRFTAEEKAKHHPCAYLPFGLGPRNCVGMRFALMEAKMALIEIVRKFKIELAPETKVLICVPVHMDGVYRSD